ncbi:anti-sigma factor domain-containing protein [Clostridium peptidivorans]|uniref:anti-sigma factor domain-containing protein n=1 Tax=Clostridium peptidivorans TaxID=100174 RepID=UPI000BE3F2C2|nr:anti-sigma factor domain-containing protein [Clostridium peptidivorans]
MNNIKGIIVEIYKSKAVLLTSTGEFVEVFATKSMNIGEEYIKTSTNISFIRNIPKALIAALLMFALLGGGLSAYYTPVATLNLRINPSVQLKTNLFNKVIYSNALNSDGQVILDNINVKNKNFNDALCSIVAESENQKFITEDYKASKSISLEVTGKNLNVSTFETTVHDHGISLEVKINNKTSTSNGKSNNKNNNLVNTNKNFNKLNIGNSSKDKTNDNSKAEINKNKNDDKDKNKNKNKNNENANNKNIKDTNSKKDLDKKNNSNSEPKKKDKTHSNNPLKKEK